MIYYCEKYAGYVTEEKAFKNCVRRGCPYLRRRSRNKRSKWRRARDKAGRDKSVWTG